MTTEQTYVLTIAVLVPPWCWWVCIHWMKHATRVHRLIHFLGPQGRGEKIWQRQFQKSMDVANAQHCNLNVLKPPTCQLVLDSLQPFSQPHS